MHVLTAAFPLFYHLDVSWFYFPCYSLAGRAEAKQALKKKIPNCYIQV
jgi:hypothetical protein